MNTIIGILIVAAVLVFIVSRAEPGSRVAQIGQWVAGLAVAAGGAVWAYVTNGGG